MMSWEERELAKTEVEKISALARLNEAEARRFQASAEAQDLLYHESNEAMLKRDHDAKEVALQRQHEYRMAKLPHTTKRIFIVTGSLTLISVVFIFSTCG